MTDSHERRHVASHARGSRDKDAIEAELLATVSHELRTPLAAIKGYATTLLRHEHRLPHAERREFLEAIGQASDRLEATIDRLLEMSQLESGAVRLERFPLDIERLVEDAVLAVRQTSEKHLPGQYTFRMTRPPAGNASELSTLLVRADARRLRHALDQVLENAVTFSPRGGTIATTIRVDGMRQQGDLAARASRWRSQPVVEIEVHDSGMGIPAEHLERIFERFHRVDNRLAREGEGMGLGLAIARRIIELHGGIIWAVSTPGDGSTFHVRLPLHETSDPRHPCSAI
ncbi:MAG TPA: ATP-binding protein [Ktedonobacterales bacterium]